MPPTRVRPPLRRDLADDAGFSVLEALVSFVLLAIVGGSSVLAVNSGISTSQGSTDRVTAGNLAQQDLQAARALRYPAYPAALSRTVTMAGRTYTVARAVGQPCPATANYDVQTSMVVTTTVTWAPTRANNRVVLATEIAC